MQSINEKLERKPADKCPYCDSKKVMKRGFRQKKLEKVQLYKCSSCKKTFTSQKIKFKKYPLRIILDGLTFYNLGFSLKQSCKFLKEDYGFNISQTTLSNWLKEFEELCRYSRLRGEGKRVFTPNQIIKSATLYHRQVYRYKLHRAKTSFLEKKYEPLKNYLEKIFTECPHDYFRKGLRSSEIRENFDLSQVIIKEKNNFATRLAYLVMQSVSNNKARHEILQKFMLANDSVTVAVEVPVFISDKDIKHFKKLGFDIPVNLWNVGDVLTGHIDFLQVRNNSIHILDFKPNAKKDKPISQLTMYALALSRLTGLRLFDFTCAWFDENNYYEFFPLHVVYKK